MPASRSHALLAAALAGGIVVAGATTASAAPHAGRSSTGLQASAGRAEPGGTVRLAAAVRDRFGAVRHATVEFYARTPGAAFRRMGSADTGADGRAAFAYRVRRTLEWQARYDGNVVDSGSASPVRRVAVTPPPPGSPAFGREVVAEAARQQGKPYEYGAEGPDSFDCSGLTKYVLGRFGVALPHDAAAQYDRTRHISPADAQPGDLVFFSRSGGINHVGIYAGDGEIWHAPQSGQTVRKQAIWTSDFLVGRPT